MSINREGFVQVYDTRTGEKRPNPVPVHYLDHPVLGRHLSLTPRSKADQSSSAGSAPSGAGQNSPTPGGTTNSTATPKEK